MTEVQQISIADYHYPLPDDRIAKYQLPNRDGSRLLVYRRGQTIDEGLFRQLPRHLPPGALLIFNNTRVIPARLLFVKESGAHVEVFCLEPLLPADYPKALQQVEQCSWQCMVGNAKRWKGGPLVKKVIVRGETITLTAQKGPARGNVYPVTFRWNGAGVSFSSLLDAAGTLPIPPYLGRATEASDRQNYQTVYSRIEGSVAAPTAGLHFTPALLDELQEQGFEKEEITLHVGAGTFAPVKSDIIGDHPMHTEAIVVHRQTIERVLLSIDRIIAVGTTSVRTLESLYHLGVLLTEVPDTPPDKLHVSQWCAYRDNISWPTPRQALKAVLGYMDRLGTNKLQVNTQILIAPGYKFRLTKGMVTNFHQPGSTLLLLVSAFVGADWRKIYSYALLNGFRFLSYGDSSLLLGNND